jgi:6-phospho-beta-glucosidase
MALQAFTINPLVQKGIEARQVLDELLVAHERYLPQFREKIIELKKLGVASKDSVVVDLIKNGN